MSVASRANNATRTSSWNQITIGPKIAKLASRHSEGDERHHVIEMLRHFPHGRFGPRYESPTNRKERMAGPIRRIVWPLEQHCGEQGRAPWGKISER